MKSDFWWVFKFFFILVLYWLKMLHMVFCFSFLTYAVNSPPRDSLVFNSNTLYIYACYFFFFFSFWGLLLGLLAKGPFFFAAVVFFAEQ